MRHQQGFGFAAIFIVTAAVALVAAFLSSSAPPLETTEERDRKFFQAFEASAVRDFALRFNAVSGSRDALLLVQRTYFEDAHGATGVGQSARSMGVAVPLQVGVAVVDDRPVAAGAKCFAPSLVVYLRSDPSDTITVSPGLVADAPVISASPGVVHRKISVKSIREAWCSEVERTLQRTALAFERRARAKIEADPIRNIDINYLFDDGVASDSVGRFFGGVALSTAVSVESLAARGAGGLDALRRIVAIPEFGILGLNGNQQVHVVKASGSRPYRLQVFWTPWWSGLLQNELVAQSYSVNAIQSIN